MKFAVALLGLLPALLAGAGFAAERPPLNLFIWSEYMDPSVLKEFEQRYQCRVNVDLYEDVESMLAKVQGGGVSRYDVVVPSDHVVPAMIQLKLLAPLRHEHLPNLRHLDARFVNPDYDPGNRYTVAYQWGTVGLLARNDPNALPETWGLLFDPRQQAGEFLLMDSMRDQLGAALKYRGHSLNSTNAAHLRAARDLLLDAKKRSLGFEGSVGAKNKVLARAARLAVVYSGEGVRAMREDPDTVYFIPREGSIIWVDSLAIPAKAPQPDLAEKFINFVLEPEVSARISRYTQFATPNKAARALLPESDLNNPALYPPADTLSRLEFLRDLGPRLRLYDEAWTQIKAR